MAQRIGAGGAFQSIDHTDAHGLLLRPSSKSHQHTIVYDDYSKYDFDEVLPYQRPQSWGMPWQGYDRDRGRGKPDGDRSPEPEHQFFVIREGTSAPTPTPPPPPPPEARDVYLQPHQHHQHQHQHQQHQRHRENANMSPVPVACFMERTASGRTILTETERQLALECADFSPEEDSQAALQVKWHMARPRQNVKRHERILRSLIHPKAHAHRDADFRLDHAALESIFSAADEIFFQGRLSRRVHWEWSSGSASSPEAGGSRIIGTTALRRASPPGRGGYETLIVLSSPILMDTGYNRRLLISTFLHELIHSYLFICCGFKARHCGGHTTGFKEIANMIDVWAGEGTLRLCDMEADLKHFLNAPAPEDPRPQKRYHHHGGVDFYDLNERPWSTGPRVVFGTQMAEGLPTRNMDTGTPISMSPPPLLTTPMSSTTALVDYNHGENFDHSGSDLQMPDLHHHTFIRSEMKHPFP